MRLNLILLSLTLSFLMSCIKPQMHKGKAIANSTAAATPASNSTSSTACTPTWKTMDDYRLRSAEDVKVDSLGNIYVVGYGSDSAVSNTKSFLIIKKSSDGGKTWSIVNEYQMVDNQNTYSNSIGFDADNSVYAVNEGLSTNTLGHWVVRKSTDQGTNWSTLEGTLGYQYASNQTSRAYGFLSDTSGIYVVGSGGSSSGFTHWLVRKSTDGGSTWALHDDYYYADPEHAIARKIAKDSQGNLYVVGYARDSGTSGAGDSAKNYRWTVRKYDGTLWSTVDRYEQTADKNSFAYGVEVDSTGNIYVVGYGSDTSNIQHWIVRKSTDAGATWSTIVDWQYVSNQNSLPYAIGTDNSGNLFVSGYGANSDGIQVWFTRTSSDGGTTWKTSDEFSYTTGQNAYASGIARDLDGNLFVVGVANDENLDNRWIVRKYACH